VAGTVDPVGGAYAIEAMTDRIEREATAILGYIEAIGGTLAAIEAGYIQRQIQDSAYAAQQAIDAGETVVVGINRYTQSETTATPVFELDPEIERHQIARLQAVRAGRSETEWRAALDAVDKTARDGGNLVPAIITAIEKQATVGEIADTMRRLFGEFQDTSKA
jgi:methylmalonyl-CoA mutase N-terminal domain/subunit